MSSLDDLLDSMTGDKPKEDFDFVCCARFTKGGSNCRICPLREEIKQEENEDNKDYERRLSSESIDFANRCGCKCEINYHGNFKNLFSFFRKIHFYNINNIWFANIYLYYTN